MRYKQFQNEFQVDSLNREVIAIISTSAPDRDNEIVLPQGLRKANYAGRPILWQHDRDIPAIGSLMWVKPGNNQVIAKFRISNKTEFADDIYQLITEGHLSAVSVGFEVFNERPATKEEQEQFGKVSSVITDWELLETSICNVPANEEAMIISKSLSEKTRKMLGIEIKDCWEWETKVAQVEAPAPIVQPLVIPRPTFARVVKRKSKDQLILEAIERHTAEELIAKIRGKA